MAFKRSTVRSRLAPLRQTATERWLSPFQRALLAAICTQTRDAQCVRHHGLGAAVMGEKLSRVALGWLVEHHESAAVRDDARRWARLLAE